MRLACGHDEGLVCARCVADEVAQIAAEVAVLGVPTPISPSTECPGCNAAREEKWRLSLLALDKLDRLGLLRRMAEDWARCTPPVVAWLAGQVLEVLDADEDRLRELRAHRMVLSRTTVVSTAQADQEDRHGLHAGRA